jgi:hypothetical protein
VSGTRNVFAERIGSGFFLDIEWNRDALARYGLSVEAAQSVVQNAIGGENVTTVIEGRERYPVNVRYMRDFRYDPDALARALVPASDGQRQIPLGELAVEEQAVCWLMAGGMAGAHGRPHPTAANIAPTSMASTQAASGPLSGRRRRRTSRSDQPPRGAVRRAGRGSSATSTTPT